MKTGPDDIKLTILITGDELHELMRFTSDMADAFGLDRRVEAYSGKRCIGVYQWDADCLLAVMDNALNDQRAYPSKSPSSYSALKRLYDQLTEVYGKVWGRTSYGLT